jgi:UDP-glucose 4-epimerase
MNGKPPVIFGDGTQTRDFIYVEDTAHWLCQVAQCDTLVGQTVNLASGRETSVRELAALVCAEAGRPDLQPVHRPARPGDVQRHLGGVARAEQTLGFVVRTDVRTGIRKLIEHLRRQPEDTGTLLSQIQETNWLRAAA